MEQQAEEKVTSFTLEQWIGKIKKLMDKADSEEKIGHAEAAAAFRAKAEELMAKYRVAEESLISDEGSSITPVLRTIFVVEYGQPFWQVIYNIALDVMRHCGVQSHYKFDGMKLMLQMVGYDIDLRYADFLFTSAKLVFAARITPEVNPQLSDKDNIYNLRSAGIDRQTIAQMVWGHQGHQEGLRVGRLYKEACAERGEVAAVSGRNVNAKTYREAYAQQFRAAFNHRLWEARTAAGLGSQGIELKGRAERVQEKFWELFPEFRPQPTEETSEASTTVNKKAKPRKLVTKADLAYANRMQHGPAATAARRAAQTAAASVVIQRGNSSNGIEE